MPSAPNNGDSEERGAASAGDDDNKDVAAAAGPRHPARPAQTPSPHEAEASGSTSSSQRRGATRQTARLKKTGKLKASGKLKRATGKLKKKTAKLKQTGKLKKPSEKLPEREAPARIQTPPPVQPAAPVAYVSDVEIAATSTKHTRDEQEVSAEDIVDDFDAVNAPPGSSLGVAVNPQGTASVTSYLSITRGIEANIDLAQIESQADKRYTSHTALPRPPRGRHGKQRFFIGPEIGRGGMGSVRTMFDTDIRRHVAMKLLLGGHNAPKEKQVRFLEEAQITGQLEHPNIVPVHDVGIDPKGHIYFTMKLVHGESLLDVIESTRGQIFGRKQEGGYTLTRLLQIFMKVCDAVDFAHAKGVLHRDLKPENVMVGDYGEVLVMDWGLAKVAGRETPSYEGTASVMTDRAESGRVQTLDGSIVGTPGHMSPEQARGRLDEVDELSDIYALGCILYEILTCEPPYPGNDPERLNKMVRRGRYMAPTKRAPDRAIPRELEEVVIKAMAYYKEERYENAGALKRDIEAFLEGRTLANISYTARQRFTKFVRRHFAAVLVALIVFTSLGVLLGSVLLSVMGERDRLEMRLDALEEELRDARDPRIAADALETGRSLAEIDRLLATGRVPEARARFERVAAVPEHAAHWYRWRLEQQWHPLLERVEVEAERGSVQSLAHDELAGATWIGTNTGELFSLEFTDATSPPQLGRTMWRHPRGAAISALCADEHGLLLGDADGFVHRISRGGTSLWLRNASDRRIESLHRLGERLYVFDGEALQTLALDQRNPVDGGPLAGARVDPASEMFAVRAVAAGQDGTLAIGSACGYLLVRTPGGVEVPAYPVFDAAIDSLALDTQRQEVAVRSGQHLALARYDEADDAGTPSLTVRHRRNVPPGAAVVYDASTGLWLDTPVGLVHLHAASAATQNHLVRADEPGQRLRRVRGLVSHGEAQLLLLHTGDGELWWRTQLDAPGPLLRHASLPSAALADVAVAPGGDALVAAFADGQRVYLSQPAWQQPLALALPSRNPRAVGFDSRGQHLFVGDAQGRLFQVPLETVLGDGDASALPADAWQEVPTRLSSIRRIVPGGNHLLLVDETARLQLFSVAAEGAVQSRYELGSPGLDATLAAAVTAQGGIVRAGSGNTVEWIAAGRTSATATFELPAGRARAVALRSPESVLVADDAGHVHRYDLQRAEQQDDTRYATAGDEQRWRHIYTVHASDSALTQLYVAGEHMLLGNDVGEATLWRLPETSDPAERIAALSTPTDQRLRAQAPIALGSNAADTTLYLVWPVPSANTHTATTLAQFPQTE